MHNATENSIECQKTDQMSKIISKICRFLHRILRISMRWTHIWTQKIANLTYIGHFGPKTAHLAMIAGFGGNDQFWSQNDHNMLHFRFFKLIFVFSASKYIGYDVKIVIFWKFIFDILSIRSSSIEFSFALCIAQTLIKFKNISYTYSMLLNPLAVGCPGGAAKIRGKWFTLMSIYDYLLF